MRFLVDECTGPNVAKWLRDQGYEVFSVFEQARGADDEAIIKKAASEKWVIITNDRDFGQKIFRDYKPHSGVIFLRLKDERTEIKIDTIRRLLRQYGSRVKDQYIVVSETRVRFARKPGCGMNPAATL